MYILSLEFLQNWFDLLSENYLNFVYQSVLYSSADQVFFHVMND